MVRKEEMDELITLVVCVIYSFCDFSTGCHIPIEAIRKQIKDPEIPFKKVLRKAEARGLIYRKGGTKSYGLTKSGLDLVREACVSE